MKTFFSIVTGIVIAALIALGVGSIAVHKWFAASSGKISSAAGNAVLSTANQTTTANQADTASAAAANQASAANQSTTNQSTTANAASNASTSANQAASASGNNTAASNSTTGSQASTPLTSSQQTSITSTIQALQSNPANAPVDCSALVQYVYKQAGIQVPRTVSQQATVGTRINSASQLNYGDIVFFDASNTPSQPTFDGVYVGNGQFVAQTTHGIVTSSLDSGYWKSKFLYGEHVS